jgi:acetate kinase
VSEAAGAGAGAGAGPRVLVLNAGSSSLKHAVLDRWGVVGERGTERWPSGEGADRHARAVRAVLEGVGPVDAVGHRVVHGGPALLRPARIDAAVRQAIEAAAELAPLHNASALLGIDAVAGALPGVPQVACPDTAFHATLPAHARVLPLPEAWRERGGLRRYGFHGLNVEWCARRAPEVLGPPAAGALVVCHLGSGCSASAVRDGRSVDTTMGWSPLEGMPMATRSGSLDPDVVLRLLRLGVGEPELSEGLQHASGVTALAGHGDLRTLLEAPDDDERAALALAVFVRGAAHAVAQMAASLGALDALVFTGGAAEGSPRLRALIAERLAPLGIVLDPGAAGDDGGADRPIHAASSRAAVAVIAADEEAMIAAHTVATLARAS